MVIKKIKQLLTDFLNRFRPEEAPEPLTEPLEDIIEVQELEEKSITEPQAEDTKRIARFSGTRISSPSKRITLDKAYPKRKKK